MRLIDADALLMELDMTEDLSAYDAVVFEEMVNAIPTADVPQWIPCSERLPEKDEDVLCYIRCASFDYMNVLWRDDYSGDWADGDNFHHEVIAWMPLPEPWKGEAE